MAIGLEHEKEHDHIVRTPKLHVLLCGGVLHLLKRVQFQHGKGLRQLRLDRMRGSP